MSRIVKNYIYNILFQALVLFTPLILSPYLVRTLGPENLGVFSYISSAANIIVTIGLLGTYNYGCRQIAYYRDDTSKCASIYNEIFTLRTFLGALITLFYILFAIFEDGYRHYIIIYYFWVLSMIFDPSWLFVGQEEMKPTAIKNACIKIICIILIFGTVKNENHLVRYTFIMGFSAFVANMLLYTQTPNYSIKHKISLYNCKEHLMNSLAYFWPQVASLFYLQVDKVMLRYLSESIEQVSYYDYGEKIVTIPLTFITVLSTVMMPRIANEFSKNNKTEMSRLLNKAGEFSLLLAIPMMLGIAICATDLIPWYLGPAYTQSIYTILCVSPIIVTNSLVGISGNQYFVATNQMGIVLKAYISAAVVNMALNAILIPRLGCIGAGIATSGAATISVIIQYYYLNKQIPIRRIIESGIRYFVYAIPMAIVVYIIALRMDPAPLTTVLQVSVGGLMYLLVLIVRKDANINSVLSKLERKAK